MLDWLQFTIDVLVGIAEGGARPFFACFLLSLSGAALLFVLIPDHLVPKLLACAGILVVGCVFGVVCERAKRPAP
jgi:hypothetical protein